MQRSLGFYKSKNADANFECIVVSGNTFRLPGLTQFIADRLGYGIIELIELEQITVADGLDRAHFLEDLQSLGVAMGLGLQGIGLGKADVNLLPSDLRLQALLKQKRWAMIAILIMLPLAFAVNHLVLQERLNQSAALVDQIKKRVAKNVKEQGDAGEVAKQIRPLAEQVLQYQHYGSHIGLMNQIERVSFNGTRSRN